jgi:hypothetical protein
VLEDGSSHSSTGNTVRLDLAGGEGKLLGLHSKDDASLTELAAHVLTTWEPEINSTGGSPIFTGETEVSISHQRPEVQLHYTLDGEEPTRESALVNGPITLKKTTMVKVITNAPGTPYDGVKISKKFIKARSIESLGYYRLGEGLSVGEVGREILRDERGNGFDLRRQGRPTVSSDAAPIKNSKVSLEFHGSDSNELYFHDRPISLIRTNFAIEIWVKASEDSSCTVVMNGHPQTSGYGIWQDASIWGGLFAGVNVVRGPAYVEPGKWTHIFLIRDESEAILYVDGVMMTGEPVTSAPNPPAGKFTIGGSNEGLKPYYFKGLIDEVRVFTFSP